MTRAKHAAADRRDGDQLQIERPRSDETLVDPRRPRRRGADLSGEEPHRGFVVRIVERWRTTVSCSSRSHVRLSGHSPRRGGHGGLTALMRSRGGSASHGVRPGRGQRGGSSRTSVGRPTHLITSDRSASVRHRRDLRRAGRKTSRTSSSTLCHATSSRNRRQGVKAVATARPRPAPVAGDEGRISGTARARPG